MTIRELLDSDGSEYRTLRLRALREHPAAFASSYELNRDRPVEAFADRLRKTSDSPDAFILGCFAEGSLVGTIGLQREEGLKRMHWAWIFGMHVAVEHQGKGYGRALLGAALERARQMPGLELVSLRVERTNEPAKGLYASAGFERYGTERRALFVDGEYFDLEHMVLEMD